MNLLKVYSKFVANHPYLLLVILITITLVMSYFSGFVGTKSMDNKDTLPDDIDVIKSFNIISDSFGGSDSIMIALETEERNDIRDPDVIEYTYLLSELASKVDDVESVTSAATLMRMENGNILPKNSRDIKQIIDNNGAYLSYISSDYTMSIIRISLTDSYDANQLIKEMREVIDTIKKPYGISVRIAGEVASDPIIEETIGPDMAKTGQVSMMGIIIILYLLFFSIRYALTPLTVILVGITWAFGFLGIIGTNLSPSTSGAISMIMGVGIDFGIQTIGRFKQELRKSNPRKSIETTINKVFVPMLTTTLAALIGFRAMSMGQLTVLSELAIIMSYGIFFCFLAAVTVVPVISVIGEEIMINLRRKLKWKKN